MVSQKDVELEIQQLEQEVKSMQTELRQKEQRLHELRFNKESSNLYCKTFTGEEVSRYSRQMLIPEVGVKGQLALKNSRVLVVGAGGLGCPASLYLSAAGVGEITIVDNDEVDLTNLHRQILHSQGSINVPKVISAHNTLTRLNSNVKVIPLHMHADSASLQKLVATNTYNVVIDGTDNVATRYLLNDLCVLNKLPLVSGSALRMEGQLTVYNYKGGPCYRCLFPKPPPPETVTSCGDGGVLGVIPGVIGILEALEAIKIITGINNVLSGRLMLFDGIPSTFRNIALRKRNANCDVCGDSPSIKSLIDYEQFCGARADDKVHNINILDPKENINAKELSGILEQHPSLLIDVRSKVEFELCHIPDSYNVPIEDIQKDKVQDLLEDLMKHAGDNRKVHVICRRGNDSQRAIHKLKTQFADRPVHFVNVRGGLHAYSKHVDATFPIY